MKRILFLAIVAAAILLGCTVSAMAAERTDYSRGKGALVRIGAGAPANAEFGFGYQLNPHCSLAAEAYSFWGLTTFTGALDARYYFMDQAFTPFVGAKAGYGLLGKTMSYRDCYDFMGTALAGLSWRGLDLGAGVIYDPFHGAQFTASLNWNIRIGGRR